MFSYLLLSQVLIISQSHVSITLLSLLINFYFLFHSFFLSPCFSISFLLFSSIPLAQMPFEGEEVTRDIRTLPSLACQSWPLSAFHCPVVTRPQHSLALSYFQPSLHCSFHFSRSSPLNLSLSLGTRVLSPLNASFCDSPWWLTNTLHQLFSSTGPNAHFTRSPSSFRPEGQEPSNLELVWHTAWEARVVFPSHAASCNLHGVTLTSSCNSDHSTVLSRTCSFVQVHLALTAPPSDQSQASTSCLSEEGPARIKDEAQWHRQKHFWGKVLFLDIYKSAEMCAILSGLCVGRGRWWCISQRKMWFRGGKEAAKF